MLNSSFEKLWQFEISPKVDFPVETYHVTISFFTPGPKRNRVSYYLILQIQQHIYHI